MQRHFNYKGIHCFWLTKWLGVNWDIGVTTKPYKLIETALTSFRIVLFGVAFGLCFDYEAMKKNYDKLTR
jgi:hypothetical protein